MYYKDMKFTDQFSINLASQEHDLIQEVFSFAYSMDFEEHNDETLFNRVWDKVSNADHQINSDSWCIHTDLKISLRPSTRTS